MKNLLHTRALAFVALLVLIAAVAPPALSQETVPDSSAVATAQSAQTLGVLTTAIPVAVGGALLAAGIAGNGGTPVSVGYLLASSGVIFGPSIGDWRGGLTGRGVGGMFLRMGFAWGGLLAAGIICLPDCEDETATAVVLLGSQGVAFGLAVWELATVKHRVIKDREARFSLTPTYSPETGSIGFAARLRF